MKKWLFLNLIIASTLILGACGTSNNVVSNKLISKRKYEKGFHINKKAHFRNTDEDVADEKLKSDDDKNDSKIKFSRNTENRNLSRKEVKSEANINESIAESSAEVQVTETYASTSDNVVGMSDEVDSPTANLDVNQTNDEKSIAKSEHNSSSQRAPSGTAELVLLIILALFLPPVAIVIYSGATGIFWIDLVLFLIAIGGFWFFRLTGMAFLAAVVIAFLVIFDVI